MSVDGYLRYLTIGSSTYEVLPPIASSNSLGGIKVGSGLSITNDGTLSTTGGGTVTSVGLTNGTNGGLSISGSPITSSGSITVGHSNVLSSAQTTSAVYPIKIDKNGHISEYGSAVSIPTKVSDLTNDSGFITGITSTDVTTALGYTPYDSSNPSGYVTTDEKLVVNQENSNNTYYPIISTSSTAASTKYIDTRGIKLDITNGTERSQGDITLVLGNSTAVNYDGNKAGLLQLYGPYSRYVQIQTPSSFTSDVYLTLPSSTGTLALTSNIKDATLTIQKNGANVETFSANASSNKTANIVVNEVPSGGTTGQALVKNSATNYDVSWADVTTTAAQIIRWTESA